MVEMGVVVVDRDHEGLGQRGELVLDRCVRQTVTGSSMRGKSVPSIAATRPVAGHS